MLEELIEKLDVAVRKLRGIGKLTEKNISESLREIRRVLLEADVNYKVVKDFISRVQEKAVGEDVIKSVTPGQQVVKIVHEELEELLGKEHTALRFNSVPPTVIMAVGLQGSGKTTFVAKLGYYLHKKGHQSLLVAADIYRPAAIQQLQTLAKSVNLSVYAEDSNDPVTIIKNAFKYARKNAYDVIILDTAGRLHIDETMMEELQNIRKAVNPAEILFVADSMTGQDAVRSALSFQEMLDFDGIVLTKLDGDAKGGAALSMRSVTGNTIKFVTSGEKL